MTRAKLNVAKLNMEFPSEASSDEADVVEFRILEPSPSAGLLPAEAPEPVTKDRPWWVVTDSDVFDARASHDGMTALWEKVQSMIQYKIQETCRKFPNLREDDLHQESWIVFDQAVARYDGRRPDSFWTYLNLSLYTRFRQCGAHDRVIPIPHDTRKERRSWHKISQETFDARVNAQDPIFVDAMEGDGWENLQVIDDETDNLIEEMDMAVLQDRFSKIPRRWANLLNLLTRHDEADVAEMLNLSLEDMQRKASMIRQVFDVLPDEEFVWRRTEAQYAARLQKILKERQGDRTQQGDRTPQGDAAIRRTALQGDRK
ncbi:hypothetical protein HFU84_07080 [Acidithiobacillus sp. CV18-2]|nr:hypothetical protein [Acidithiobacillus sp. CV18-3]MBU2755983.1 hypothetical protein [Acidithiobacillus sp. BN09-2]MBU2777268.1 hypothetical protein [Acidithiobacillus sp. CV18-2]MBU2799882.1 hypothetical protein [Acidithiobacillus sp. VAN18-4]